jgi:hypothetical protein
MAQEVCSMAETYGAKACHHVRIPNFGNSEARRAIKSRAVADWIRTKSSSSVNGMTRARKVVKLIYEMCNHVSVVEHDALQTSHPCFSKRRRNVFAGAHLRSAASNADTKSTSVGMAQQHMRAILQTLTALAVALAFASLGLLPFPLPSNGSM